MRRFLQKLAGWFGSDIIDQRTGEKVARAILVCWRGRVYLLGYEGRDQVMPVFLPQQRMTHWKRELGFATHPPPDFPREVP
jgi:hypothetical protein